MFDSSFSVQGPQPSSSISYCFDAFNPSSAQHLTSPSCPTSVTLDPVITGSSVLGIKYDGGVLLACDLLGSFGSLARYRNMSRMYPLSPSSTLIAASGEMSDFQYICKKMEQEMMAEYEHDDGNILTESEIHKYLSRVYYYHRSRFNPLYNVVLVAAYNNTNAFLGYTDHIATTFEYVTLATGYGAYLVRGILRDGWKPDLTEEEARKLLEKSLQVLFYRDARTINSVQIGRVNKDGVTISEPFSVPTVWPTFESWK